MKILVWFYLSVSVLSSCIQKSQENETVNLDIKPRAIAKGADSNHLVPVKISSIELTQEFLANEVRANMNYKNRPVNVNGRVDDIKMGVSGNSYVILQGIERFTSVQCFLKDLNQARELEKNEVISISGECTGLNANVIIENAVLVGSSK